MSSPIRALSPGSSLASYDFFSHSRSQSHDREHASSGDSDSYGTVSEDGSSDDEILLSFSDLSSADFLSQRGARTPVLFSDEEFVLMSRPRTPGSDDLTASFSALSLSGASTHSHSQSRHRRKASSASRAKDGPSSPPASSSGSPKKRDRKKGTTAAQTRAGGPPDNGPKQKHHSPSKARRKARRAAARATAAGEGGEGSSTSATAGALSLAEAAGFGDRPIVDDVSEAGSEFPHIPSELYKSAQRYVSSVLSADPSDHLKSDMSSKLAFLQALIIELGLYTSLPSLPNSLRAAKALLKSQVFVNVRDYLAVRSQGIEALRGVMHPTRSALLREIRGGKREKVKTVKESGLGVLLVTCYR